MADSIEDIQNSAIVRELESKLDFIVLKLRQNPDDEKIRNTFSSLFHKYKALTDRTYKYCESRAGQDEKRY